MYIRATNPQMIIAQTKMNPNLLVVSNGIVDLRTGELRAPNEDDCVTTASTIAFDPNTPVDFIHQLFMTIFAQDEAMVSWFQKLLGYLITGEVDEHLFFIFVGVGNNGKSVIVNLIQCLLSEMFTNLDKSILLDGIDTHSNNFKMRLAKLKGCRVAHIGDLELEDKFDTDALLQLIDGDCITHKCVVTANRVPAFNTVMDKAIADNIMCIPFQVTFTKIPPPGYLGFTKPTLYVRQYDHELEDKLKQHLPNFLTWAVQGAVKWYATKDLVYVCAPKSVYTLGNPCTQSDLANDLINDPEQRRKLISLLQSEYRAAEDNEYRESCLLQPMAGLVRDSYGCKVLEDGTEVFEGNGLTITIPPSCVKWAPGRQEELRPKGPTEMDISRRRLMFLLQEQERAAPKMNEKDQATIEALIKDLKL